MEGAGDFELGWYKGSVTAALYARWRKPILEGITEPREVRVTFQIQRNGQVTNPKVEQSSGVPSLDRSALRAVADASPLPPLPPNWREPTLSAGFVFRLYPE
jgi:protein TonB